MLVPYGWLNLGFLTNDDSDAWSFSEEAHLLKVEKILFQGKSDHQNVLVFRVFSMNSCLLHYFDIFPM